MAESVCAQLLSCRSSSMMGTMLVWTSSHQPRVATACVYTPRLPSSHSTLSASISSSEILGRGARLADRSSPFRIRRRAPD